MWLTGVPIASLIVFLWLLADERSGQGSITSFMDLLEMSGKPSPFVGNNSVRLPNITKMQLVLKIGTGSHPISITIAHLPPNIYFRSSCWSLLYANTSIEIISQSYTITRQRQMWLLVLVQRSPSVDWYPAWFPLLFSVINFYTGYLFFRRARNSLLVIVSCRTDRVSYPSFNILISLFIYRILAILNISVPSLHFFSFKCARWFLWFANGPH